MKSFLILTTSLLLSTLSWAQSSILLESQDIDSGDNVVREIIVSSDGTVTRSINGFSEVIQTLPSFEIAQIQSRISTIAEAPLIRLDPNQIFQPGTFIREYMANMEDGTFFTFAKYLRGVDFVLPAGQSEYLEAILASFANAP